MNFNGILNDSKEDILELVSFTIGNEFYALEINCIREIIKVKDITRVPNTPNYIKGVINLRGKVIPIIDMRKKLNLQSIDFNKNSRILIIEYNNMMIGIIVDTVKEVLKIDNKVTENTPDISKNGTSDYISSIGKLDDKLINILNLDNFIQHHNLN